MIYKVIFNKLSFKWNSWIFILEIKEFRSGVVWFKFKNITRRLNLAKLVRVAILFQIIFYFTIFLFFSKGKFLDHHLECLVRIPKFKILAFEFLKNSQENESMNWNVRNLQTGILNKVPIHHLIIFNISNCSQTSFCLETVTIYKQ